MIASADWDRVKQLFHAALDVAPDARASFVRERAGDAQVFTEVMSLLEAHPAAEGFLSTPADPAQVSAAVARLHRGSPCLVRDHRHDRRRRHGRSVPGTRHAP